jgi:hypothetical protein
MSRSEIDFTVAQHSQIEHDGYRLIARQRVRNGLLTSFLLTSLMKEQPQGGTLCETRRHLARRRELRAYENGGAQPPVSPTTSTE